MQTLKNVLIGIGILAIILFIVFMVIGIKVVSTLVMYIVGTIAVIALIGFGIYYIKKLFNRDNDGAGQV